MKDYTHVIVISIVDKMNEYRRYSEAERIVITYGLELFFNTFFKLIIYLAIGCICDILIETIIAVFVLAILRILSGGYHSQSDFGCLILTGGMIFLPIILSKYLCVIGECFCIFLLGIIIVYFFYVPQDNKYLGLSKEKLMRVKIKVILIMMGMSLGGLLISNQLGCLVMFVALVQGLSLIKGGAYESNAKYD